MQLSLRCNNKTSKFKVHLSLNLKYSQSEERCSPAKSTTPVSMVASVQEEYIRSFSLTKRFFDDLDAAANRNR